MAFYKNRKVDYLAPAAGNQTAFSVRIRNSEDGQEEVVDLKDLEFSEQEVKDNNLDKVIPVRTLSNKDFRQREKELQAPKDREAGR